MPVGKDEFTEKEVPPSVDNTNSKLPELFFVIPYITLDSLSLNSMS